MKDFKIISRYVVFCLLTLSADLVCFGGEFRDSVSLNGKWQFKLVEPKGQDGFSEITVPGNWELQGFSRPLWRWPKKEKGVYKTEFSVPKSWDDKKIYLNFAGVLYRAKIYIDGRFVGEHESGYTEFEFEITDFVKPGGKAELKVEVYTYGKYFDCDSLDFWALAGIFRDVTLIARPKVHVQKWQYSAEWSESKADVTVSGQLNENIDGKVVLKLGFKGEQVLEKSIDVECGIFEDVLIVENPRGWTAETPELYDAQLVLEKGGREVDKVVERIGLREIEVVGGKLLINGRAIRIFGVARHDLWPEVGRAIGEDVTMLDIELMKKTGVNAVRTAHHTCEKAFLKLADEVGLYVIDNIAMSNIYKPLQSDPNYTQGVLVRTRETIARDLLHPSVIIWAMGNEMPMCYQHKKMYEEIRRLDQSRPTIMPSHRGKEVFPELNSVHYPTGYSLLNAITGDNSKPMICTEYQHCGFEGMGGGLEEFWDIMDISGCGAGGTAWEWMDQGIKHRYIGSWEGRWWRGPEKSKWPEVVTIKPGGDTEKMPSGFGPGDSRTPVTINIEFNGDKGDYKLNLYVLGNDESERIEVSCDDEFAGVYRTGNEAIDLSYTVKLRYKGRHEIYMKWDRVGGGHDFDCIEFVDGRGKVVWAIGKKDGSADEFAAEPANEMADEFWVDTSGNQGTDGMLGPRREKQDEYYNFRGVYAPVQIKQKSIDLLNLKWVVDVENRYSFTDLKSKTQFVLQYYDGKDIREKIIDGPELEIDALSKKKMVLDISFIEKQKNLSAICWQVPGDGECSPDKLGQVWFNVSEVPPMNDVGSAEIKTEVQGDQLVVNVGKTEILFNRQAGALTSYRVNDKVLISDAIKVSMWRPSFSFEQQFLYRYALGLHSKTKMAFLDREPDGDFVRRPRTMQYERIGDRVVVTFINSYFLSGSKKELMRGYEAYEINPEGGILLKCCWWWKGDDSQLRRLGFDFVLAKSFDEMTWSGEGPWACYGDAKAGTNDCVHQLERADKRVGTNKTDCRWVKWSDGESELIFNPDWDADIQASVLDGVTVQRVSRARGCGNKHMLPLPETLVWLFNNQVIQMAIEINGY